MAAALAATAGVNLLAAACGGGPRGAGSTAHQTAYQRELAYAECMRAHGDRGFPDPQSDGTFNTTKANIGAFSGPQFASANKACGHLEGSRAIAQRQQATAYLLLLKFAA